MTASNPLMRGAIVKLEKAGSGGRAPVWNASARMLGAPAGRRVEVNLGRLSRISKQGEPIFVPGKVLGFGTLDKKLTVGAFSFSAAARSKIVAAGGVALSVAQFLDKFPEGKGVKLVR